MNFAPILYIIGVLIVLAVVVALFKIWVGAELDPRFIRTIYLLGGLALLAWIVFLLTGWTLPGLRRAP